MLSNSPNWCVERIKLAARHGRISFFERDQRSTSLDNGSHSSQEWAAAEPGSRKSQGETRCDFRIEHGAVDLTL